jgi:ketosteroid isomerase-like protein
LLCTAIPTFAQQSDNEKAVWKLETSYWEYVKANDLDNYRDLWHPNFVGWPASSAQPARKDHITDWITVYNDNGSRMQWFTLQPAASQATENIVVTHYWVTAFWVDKAGQGEPSTSRITHTWIKTPSGWQIISGMSARTHTE